MIQRLRALAIGTALVWPVLAFAAPETVVQGVSDAALRNLIEQAVVEPRGGATDALDLRRRAVAAAKAAVSVLRSEGYYDGAAEPVLAPGEERRVVIKVEPGKRYLLAAPRIAWDGDPPTPEARADLQGLMVLVGAPGRAPDVVSAEGRLAARLRALGYAQAEILPRRVVVDHAALSVAVTYRLHAGPRVRLGRLRLAPGARTRQGWAAGLATWKPGGLYDPALMARLEKRFMETGGFEAATAAPGEPGPDGRSDVIVTVVERKSHALELGAGYSTTEGSGVDAKWTWYGGWRSADSLALTAKAYDIQQKFDLELTLPDWRAPDQTLKLGGGFLRDRTPAYDDVGGGLRASLVRKWDRTSALTFGATFDYASTKEKTAVNLLAAPVGETLNLYVFAAKAEAVIDRSNSLLDPSKGWRLDLEADPTLVTGDRALGFLKSQAQLSAYLPVSTGPVLAGRVRIGSILGGSIPGVPADRRFFAGGGGSVRGFGYQAVGPRLSDNTPEGGLSLFEASVEARQKISRQWSVVAFADAGAVGQDPSPPMKGLSYGAGLGLRYDMGFGPLRVDLATPLNPRARDSRLQVYISIGQAF